MCKISLIINLIQAILADGEYYFDSGRFGFDFGNIGALAAMLPSNNKFAHAEVKDTKLFSNLPYSAAPCCLSILWHKIQTSSS